MKKGQKADASIAQNGQKALTLSEYAYQVISEHFQGVACQEKAVLSDRNPEHLHQMRVGTRRLRTALEVFGSATVLPKAASGQRLRNLARVLGKVRDLDVQISSLQQDYLPQIPASEQVQLEKTIATLQKQRPKAFKKMELVLTGDRYTALKRGYEDWVSQPTYEAIAELPILSLLPDLLTPLLSELLLHPGWLIPAQEASGENGFVLHDLRKLCKHVRYEAEFFTPFYGKDFQKWIKEIKGLQECLGDFQDTQVLLDLLSHKGDSLAQMPELQTAIHNKQALALANWDKLRQKYLEPTFRYRLHQLLLQPTLLASPSLEPLPSETGAIDGTLARN
ncbi:MAG: CHAD domain-containing protein [Oscillatoriophycideae cyanobacterium NC_groundwater_1537_Pr4_S-0.65um_50_18]|nr:CHAD domain-containing protein [Oscillatoriophycideae cyanobacterium NC_groundwater_1537_Pr4_S-0.65um_50_18]